MIVNIKLKIRKYQVFFVLFIIYFSSFVSSSIPSIYAQSDSPGQSENIANDKRIAELRVQIDALTKEAEQYRGNIASEHTKIESLQREITILHNQINKIQTQIYITSKSIDKTEIEIENTEGTIFDTRQKINYKKDAIGRLLLARYKQDTESLLITLVKNMNLSDFFKFTQYFATINLSLINLIDELKTHKQELEDQKSDLETQKSNLEELNQTQKQQNYSLAQTKTSKNQLLAQTKGQEVAYQKMLANVERRKSLFFTELKELETKVIQGGLYILHIKAENIPPKKTKIFKWPEDDYRITQSYGMTTYARRGAYGGAAHNGIDMAAGYSSPVKAIGDGEIIANGKNDGWGNWVAIVHQPYNLVSVYGHLSAFEFLQVGTKVKTGQVIGYEGATGNSTGSHLHLSLYKEFFTYVKEKNGQLYFNYFDGSMNPLDYL